MRLSRNTLPLKVAGGSGVSSSDEQPTKVTAPYVAAIAARGIAMVLRTLFFVIPVPFSVLVSVLL
jgi:hypothetical protein